MEEIIISIDIGATKVAAALSNKEKVIVRIQQTVNLKGDPDSIPLQVRSLIDRCIIASGSNPENISAIGISSAGPFRKKGGMIELVSPNICGGMAPERGVLPNQWTSVPLEKELKKYYSNLIIENDAVAGAVAERTFGHGIGRNNILYITWSTGIGTGAFVDGRLIRGKNGNAPHGGHIYLGLSGPTCGCGNICDLEAVASGTAIGTQYGANMSTAEVFERYHKGDDKAIEIINKATSYFTKGLASLNAVLDTSLITIGGSVFLNNMDLLLPRVKEEFYSSFPLLSSNVEILPTGLGKYLGDVAALSLVIPDHWLEDWRQRRPWERSFETLTL